MNLRNPTPPYSGNTAIGKETAAPGSEAQAAENNLSVRTTGTRSIARMSEARALLDPKQLESRKMIHRDMPARGHADVFRELRTRLLAMANGQNFVTMIAPVSPGSGASFVARNLATAFAFDEAKTALLVDCNLRHPGQHGNLDVVPEHGGLIDYLENPSIGLERVIYSTGIARLRLIPAGRPREMSGEYFSSYRMRAVVDMLRSRYADRYLFLDGPAVKGSPDARILADLADLVIVVAGYGRDTAAAINQAVSAFDPAKLAGVVFDHSP